MRTVPSNTGNALSPTALSLPGPDRPLAFEPRRVKADMARRWVEVYKAQRTK
jgi:hypothetical protein